MNNDARIIDEIGKLKREVERLKRVEVGGVWTAWTPTAVGWAATPTVVARYCLIGKLCFFDIYATGTSNATGTTLTLPYTAATVTDLNWSGASANSTDNGTLSTSGGRWAIASAGTTVAFLKDMANGAWTDSGTKTVRAQGFYEVA